MHKSVMRQLLPLAVVCLLAAQLAAGARTTPGRSLLRQLVPDNITLGRQQFVQATWALEGVTCDDVTNQTGLKYVNNTLAQKVILDFQAELTKQGWPEAAKTVVAVRQPCVTFDINGTKYASYRVLVRFNSTTTTAVKDTMFLGAVTGPCVGGYNKTLYSNVAALFKDFKVSQNNGNRQNVWNNGVPNWIEYAAPNMTVCQPKPSPSPSPSPVPVDSPSPSPVASPSPSPSPSPDLCPSNATLVNGTCTCNAGLLPSTNGTILVSCTAGTTCPAAAPVAVKDQAGVTTGCITTNTPCPASNSLIFYSGSPSVRIECRNNPGGCNVPPFSILVQNAAGAVIGCANVTSDDCPFVAFRNGITTNWALAKCQDVTSCPVFSTGNTDYTVPLLLTNAPNAVPKACVTVPVTSQQTCPSTPSLNFPVEVMFAEPTSPVCGSELSVPPQVCNGNRVIACYAPGVDCVAPYSLRLFTNTTGPTVAECRQLRTVCDLTTTGMGSLNPNANSYNLPTYNGQNVEGCMIAGTTACPAAYPIVLQSPSGGLAGCQKIGQNLTSCTSGQIPLYNAAGALQSCQAAATPCPAAFPITMWDNLIGTRAGCYANGTTQCPSGYSLATYGTFTARPNNLTITNCFKDNSFTQCANVFIASGAVQPGAEGAYPTNIRNGNNVTVGCVQASAPSCPSSAPFQLITYNAGIPASSISGCSSTLTTCSADFPVPGTTQGVLTACIKITASAGQVMCPAAYPIVVASTNNPTLVGPASFPVQQCMTASSTCLNDAPKSSPFTFAMSTPADQVFCVPVTGLTSCANYPEATLRSGLPIYQPDGSLLIGCTQAASCPAQFPVPFLNGQQPVPAAVRCQASVAGTCSSASNGLFPLPVVVNGVLTACQAVSTSCLPDQVEVAVDATTSVTIACLPPGTTTCPSGLYDFPLYTGNQDLNTKGATLRRCITRPAGATNCNAASLSTYIIEAFDASGVLAGCVAPQATGTTYCPFLQPVPNMMQGAPDAAGLIPFMLIQCRASASCGAQDGSVTFSIPLRNVPQINNNIVGCLASTSTACPGAGNTDPTTSSVFAPFFVVGASGLVECRQVPNPPGTLPGSAVTCEQFLGATTPYTVESISGAFLAGCSLVGAPCGPGFLPPYDNNGIPTSGCVVASCTATTTPIKLYNAAGVQVGCGTSTTCAATPFSGLKIYPSGGPNAAAFIGCMAPAATACPSSLGPAVFTLWAVPPTNPTTEVPVASQCWVDAGGVQNTCANLGLANYAEVTAVPGTISTTVTDPNPLRGCTPVDTATSTRRLCPATAPYFIMAGTVLAVTDRCVINALTQSSCASSVPIVDTTSSTATAPVIGCYGAAPALTTLGACPAANTLPVDGTFTFPIATATAFTGINRGDVVRCIKPTTTCGSSVPVGTAAAPSACLINVNDITCPPAGATGAAGFTIAFYGPTSGSDATAKLELCGAPPAVLCSAATAPYIVPVNSVGFTAVPTTGDQIACAKATTACPAGSFPVIDTTNKITGCRTNPGGASSCDTNYVPFCGGTATATAQNGVCAAVDIVGCTLFGGSTSPTTTCAAATANKYPVATGFPIFVAGFSAGGGAPTTRTCYTTTAVTCGAGTAPAQDIYTVRAITGTTLNGCTDTGTGTCSTWWSPLPKTCVYP